MPFLLKKNSFGAQYEECLYSEIRKALDRVLCFMQLSLGASELFADIRGLI